MGLVIFQVLEEQGALVQVVFQDILDTLITDRIGLQGPFAGIVQSP
jgi:hypothetical protein